MKSYIIEGGKKLQGEINVSGSKNASLPILASTILVSGTSRIYNVPNIQDTKITLEILKILGCKVNKNSGKIEINSKDISKTEIPQELMHQMRSTVILAGALLGRFKQVTFTYPGGCDIGARPIDLHLKAFKKLGINIDEEYGFIKCSCDKIVGANIDLDFPSVGATENIILASVLAEGKTVITNAAREPEIVNIAMFLNSMGAKITGAGTSTIRIKGVKNMHSSVHEVIPDRIEAGTYIIASIITDGELKIQDANIEELGVFKSELEDMGVKFEKDGNILSVIGKLDTLKPARIRTMPHPGFPTDMQPQMMLLLSLINGVSEVEETVFENRFMHVQEFNRMGTDISIRHGVAFVNGGQPLTSAEVMASDLRAGAALVLAGLVAEGETILNRIYHVDRGYDQLEKKLNSVGAQIERIKLEA